MGARFRRDAVPRPGEVRDEKQRMMNYTSK